jgi:tetratricopeptide (TPR) repeat protein
MDTIVRLMGATGLAGAVAIAGCGGGGGGGTTGGGGGGGTSGDDHVTTASGTAITQAAQDDWAQALAAFNTARTTAGGFTPAACQNIIHLFEEANSTQGGHFTEAVYMIGVTNEQCGNASAAHDYYQRTLSMNDHFCGARVAMGIEQYRAGHVDQAMQEFTRSTTDDTRCTEGYVNMAIVQRRNASSSGDALNNLRRALAIDSSFLPAFNQMALLYYDQAVRTAGGQVHVQGGVPALSGDGDDDDSSSHHHQTVREAQGSQLLDLAEVVCRQAQLINGDYAPIYNTWGLINMQQGNIIAGLAKFERAFNLDPTMFEAFMNFGEVTLGFRGYDDAAGAFTHATQLNPQSYDAFIGLGAARRGLQDPDASEAAYRSAIALDGNRPEAYFNLGLLYQDYKDGAEPTLRQAQDFYRQFASHAGSDPVFAPAVDAVNHHCPDTCPTPPAQRGHRRRRAPTTCAMGRIQQIDTNICLVHELAEMQASIAQMQADMQAREAAQAAQQGTPPADGSSTPPADGSSTPPADGSGGTTPAPAPQ